jgi:hypothetical protein
MGGFIDHLAYLHYNRKPLHNEACIYCGLLRELPLAARSVVWQDVVKRGRIADPPESFVRVAAVVQPVDPPSDLDPVREP